MSMRSTIPEWATVSIASDVLASELGSDLVMLCLRDGTYYGLNEVGAEIWRVIRTPSTVARIVASIVEMYEVDAERCRADVVDLIAALAERRLVEIREGT